MVICYLGIGSNLGDRKKNIKRALEILENIEGIRIEKVSKIYETKPLGGPPQGEFLNGVVKIKTSLSPFQLLRILKRIEKDLGRKKRVRFGPREIDLDILFYGGRIINTRILKIPHPRIFEREFVLKPLTEIL
jgi:2-amino-4-hydroxy-6-hydroxymethyldihydropteridine diphosphokinase